MLNFNIIETLQDIPIWDQLDKLESNYSKFFLFKSKDGRDAWAAISGSSFKDLEEEIISRQAIQDSIESSERKGDCGELLLYHFPGSVIGSCKTQLLAGNFLIEAGFIYDNEIAQKFLRWVEEKEPNLGVSVGFQWSDKDILSSDTVKRIYKSVYIFERSVLRQEHAACPWTKVWMKEDLMSKKNLEALKEIVGEEIAEEIVAEAESKTEELKGMGVEYKEIEEVIGEVEDATETPAEEVEEIEKVEEKSVASALKKLEAAIQKVEDATVKKSLTDALEELKKGLEGYGYPEGYPKEKEEEVQKYVLNEEAVGQLAATVLPAIEAKITEALSPIIGRLEALERDEDAKFEEKVKQLPILDVVKQVKRIQDEKSEDEEKTEIPPSPERLPKGHSQKLGESFESGGFWEGEIK